MAKFLLKAGAEIDFLTEEELGKRLDGAIAKLHAALRDEEGHTITHVAGPFLSDGSGNTTAFDGGAAPIYRVPAGYTAYLTRMTVDFPGSSFKTQTSCDFRLVRGANTPGSLITGTNAIPAIFDASKSHAPLLRDGERVSVAMTGGPVSTNITCTLQVLLVRNKPAPVDVTATG